MIAEIIRQATEMGACGKIKHCGDWKDLRTLLLSPQGREFCRKHNYPSRGMWHSIKRIVGESINEVRIDCGRIRVDNHHRLAVIGATEADVYCSGCSHDYLVIAQHGATVTVHANDYAVVKIECLSDDCKINIVSDNTAIVIR